MDGCPIHSGGRHVAAERYIAPTLLDSPAPTSAVMQEEIFGPILPVLPTHSLDEAIAFVGARPKPLALYMFSNDVREQQRVLEECSFGGGCINDTLTHFVPTSMPFGGVGASGYGRYHGKAGFETFSNTKAVLRRSRLALDWLVRLRPYRNWQLRLLRLFLR
jgi:acyl-CoA reductase-like NAD-dependent aldehyde dehydrogenase